MASWHITGRKAMHEGAETFQLKHFLLSIVEMLKVNQNAEITYPQEEIRLHINKTALEQIMVNLLQNAIKYNDSELPQIVVGFSEDDTNYYFTVSDNGRGISKEELEKIFELFTTLGERDRFGVLGTGIGLSTVKKLVEKMSGKITLKSESGKGSEFSFQIKKQK
jgi:signal transduction histidine kinase